MVLARYGSDPNAEDAKLLGESLGFQFSGKVAKNRFLKGATSEQMASWDQHDLSKRGIPSERLIRLYEAWGRGGYGVILTGNVMIHPEHLEAPGNIIMYGPHETPERMKELKRMAEAGKIDGSLMVAQLSHPGRQTASFLNPNPVSAGDIKLDNRMGMSFGKPAPLTKAGIQEVVDQFVSAADIAYRAGFDGVQLHGAHGYLLAQFLSQTTNNRADEYGGSIENRARIIGDIVAGIQAKIPDPNFIIGIKINSTEFQAKGFQPEEAAELCKEFEAWKIDFVELSGGTYEESGFKHDETKRDSTKKREAFFTEFAKTITPSLTKTIPYVTGGFRSTTAMAEAVRSGSCAGIGFGRPAASDPSLPADIIAEKVGGATESKLPPNDFGLGVLAAGAQMEAIGRGEPVFDLSDNKVLQKVTEALKVYHQKTAENIFKNDIKAGYVVLSVD